jgi:ubiquinone/menaquinone biosynthesis C-methylase UbiE
MSDIQGTSQVRHAFDDATRSRLNADTQRRSIDRLSLKPGLRVLDVGCGTGAGSFALAAAVGVAGVVYGVDYDAVKIEGARRRALHDSVESRVFFHQANAIALPWPDDYFSASRSDRVFQHMLEPVRAFDELVRVTRPGGRVVVIDGDWETLSIDADDLNIDLRLPYFQATLRSQNTQSGQCLLQLFARSGLRDVTLDVQPLFESDADAAWCWQQSLTPAADADGRYASANILVISGRKS